MTEIMPFPENNYETVLLDRPFGWFSYSYFREKLLFRSRVLYSISTS